MVREVTALPSAAIRTLRIASTTTRLRLHPFASDNTRRAMSSNTKTEEEWRAILSPEQVHPLALSSLPRINRTLCSSEFYDRKAPRLPAQGLTKNTMKKASIYV